MDMLSTIWAWLVGVFTTTPLDEALAMCGAFLVCAYLVSLNRVASPYVAWLWQLLLALTITRYIGSYVIYGRPLREGAWPIVWNCFAILGAHLACRRKR
jgi:hypothetical protein